jgi:hypothetical protein
MNIIITCYNCKHDFFATIGINQHVKRCPNCFKSNRVRTIIDGKALGEYNCSATKFEYCYEHNVVFKWQRSQNVILWFIHYTSIQIIRGSQSPASRYNIFFDRSAFDYLMRFHLKYHYPYTIMGRWIAVDQNYSVFSWTVVHFLPETIETGGYFLFFKNYT